MVNLKYDQDRISLIERVNNLEKKVEGLRVNRRILMSLLIQVEKEKNGKIQELEFENNKLKRNNAAFAKKLWVSKQKVRELTEKLGDE